MFYFKVFGKNTNRKRKANLFYENDSPFIVNVEIDFFIIYTVLGSFYRSRVYMRINIRMSFDCMHFTSFFLRLYGIRYQT